MGMFFSGNALRAIPDERDYQSGLRLGRTLPGWAAVLLCASFFAFPGSGTALSAGIQQAGPTNALYLLTFPAEYDAFEELVKGYRDSGANTLIVRPVSRSGVVDRQAFAKAVFFAHGAGLKLFVVLPTRSMTILLDRHPGWEDMHYDLNSGTIQPDRKLDLFNPSVRAYLTDLFTDIAGYSVDAILLDEDFYYGDTEGMSAAAMAEYRQKYAAFFSPRNALGSLKGDERQTHQTEEYGESFWKFAELKKEILLTFVKNLMQSARTVNAQVKFGMPLHVPGLYPSEKEELAWYSYDVSAFKKADMDFFWLRIAHREIRERLNSNYKKSIETVSRISVSTLSLLNEPSKVIIVLQAQARSGRILPLFEIEEISMQVKKAGEPGMAFTVDRDSQLPAVLTKKIFRRQPE